jgi:glycosyltransferase involved in cell wall biosynthesis
MKIAVFINDYLKQNIGGGFSFLSRMIEVIDDYCFSNEYEVCFLVKNKLNSRLDNLKKCIIEYDTLQVLNKKKIFFRNKNQEINLIEESLKSNKIDLLYFITPETYNINFPYIINNWDLGHRSCFAFPEFTMNGTFEFREENLVRTLRKSIAVITESQSGKNEILNYLNLFESKVFILPIFSGNIVSHEINEELSKKILKKYNLNKKFIIYPAQFWSHKNHYNLILAFKKLIDKNYDFELVLTGSDKGNLNYILETVKQLDLEKRVRFLGFVDEIELLVFYKSAISLVYPSLLGPTNMPILEAFELKIPVVCSDLPGHREISNNQALYFNPLDPDDICEKIIKSIGYKYNFHSQPISNSQIGENIESIFDQIIKYRKVFGLNFKQF